MPGLTLPETVIQLIGLALILAVGTLIAAREIRTGVRLNIEVDDKRDKPDRADNADTLEEHDDS